MADAFAQLASISAVLGGFAVTFLSVVLTHADQRRRVGVALGLAATTAACFFVCALGWSLLAARAAGPGAVERAVTLSRPLSLLFIGGTLLLFAVLGVSGWLRSRALGIVTTGVGVVAALGAWAVLRQFIS